MNRRAAYTLFIFGILHQLSFAQSQKEVVYTADLDNFWNAYDSVIRTKDSTKQIQFIQTLYIDRGSPGLKAFMEARDYTAQTWQELIRQYPRFWTSIRPNTLRVQSRHSEIEHNIEKLKQLYPKLKPAGIYFSIGGLNTGGTVSGNKLLMGTEIISADAQTDVSDFTEKWLPEVFKEQDSINTIAMIIHEYVHTQQKGEPVNLLGIAIKEGACDFISELVTGRPLKKDYILYGRQHEEQLKDEFREEMYGTSMARWMYNGSRAPVVADLGYFMGYAICKSYYDKSSNKKKAIKRIIQLKYDKKKELTEFLDRSGFYTDKIDRDLLAKRLAARRPAVVMLQPFNNRDTLVDAGLRELKIIFSRPMDPRFYSFSKSDADDPMIGVKGFSPDRKEFTILVDLKPGKEYGFVITDRGFRSVEGYSLYTYTVHFRTR